MKPGNLPSQMQRTRFLFNWRTVAGWRWLLEQAWSVTDSRRVTAFIGLKLLLFFVQLAVGVYTSSLHPVSCAFHTAFDVCMLGFSLLAIVISRFNANSIEYPFGYERCDVLAAFCSAVYLSFVATFLIFESFHQLYMPAEVHANAVFMSFVGLLLDAVGVGLLYRNASFPPLPSSVHVPPQSQYMLGCGRSLNLHGVFLHLTADIYSHAGLLLSAYMVRYMQWSFGKGLPMMVVAGFVMKGAWPLLRYTGLMLLQTRPESAQIDSAIQSALRQVSYIDGVLEVSNVHFWSLSPSIVVGTLHIRVRADVGEVDIRSVIDELFANCVTELTVHVSQDEPVNWLLQ